MGVLSWVEVEETGGSLPGRVWKWVEVHTRVETDSSVDGCVRACLGVGGAGDQQGSRPSLTLIKVDNRQ